MRRCPLHLILSLLLTYAAGTSLSAQSLRTAGLPDYPQPLGVSAPFAGFVGSKLVVAGGCNFPGKPAAEGGQKAYYADAYALDVAQDSLYWTPLPYPLPAPTAYGAAVATPEGLICLGGQGPDGPRSSVVWLKVDGCHSLPALPAPIDNGGAALCGSILCATGGNQPGGGKALYALDLDAPDGWRRLSDYPGPQRVQPVVVGTPDALYVAGGYAFDASGPACTPSTDLLRYDLATGTWSHAGSLPAEADGTPRCLAGGSGVYAGGKLWMTGGVNLAIFRQAMEGRAPKDYMTKTVAWYRFNDDLLAYDPAAGTWQTIADVPGLARAGGVLLARGSLLYMVCGETKPGIRSPQITVVSRQR